MSAIDEPRTPNGLPSAGWRGVVARLAGLAATVLSAAPIALSIVALTYSSASAQEIGPSASEIRYEHWGIQQGAPESILALAQTNDGYLWIGGPTGLFRFDGVQFERFRPRGGDSLLSNNIFALFAPASGGLWVGHVFGGFSFVNNGRVTNYGGETAATTGTIVEFAEGPGKNLWAVTASGLWRFECSEWHRQRTDWASLVAGPSRIGFDRNGTLWLMARRTLYYLLPGAAQFKELTRNLAPSTTFIQHADGMVLTSPHSGHEALHASPILGKGSFQLLDSNDGVWTMASQGGLRRSESIGRLETTREGGTPHPRAAGPPAESYGINVRFNARLVDREGNVWFADTERLYRFYYSSLKKQTLPNENGPFALAPREGGGVWIGATATDDLYTVANGTVETLRPPSPEVGWSLLYAAPDNTLWFGGQKSVWHFVDGRFSRTELPPEIADQAGYLQAITPDRRGGLWFSFGPRGLYRLAGGAWTSFGGRTDIPKTGVVSQFTDRAGRVWFGFTMNQLAMLDEDRLRLFGPQDGIRLGNITAIHGRGSAIWIGGEFGLLQFDEGRFRDVKAVNDDWLRGISGIVETAGGDLWLNGLAGILHIGPSEIANALKDSRYRVRAERLTTRHGVPGSATQIRPLPSAIESSDGRLWFALKGGVMWIDPANPPKKATRPPIAIQSIAADGRDYHPEPPLELPAHTTSVSINYSAVSLTDPEAIRIRYQLLNTDAGWQETGRASAATYRNLSPGVYTFRVGASDTDGVWSDETIASVTFTILPAWYQTWVFRGACVAAGVMILWGLYRYRLLQLSREFDLRLEERVSERTRIAGELHDTLLQTVTASRLAARQALSHGDDPAYLARSVERLETWLSQAEMEGRAALDSLRTATRAEYDLATAFQKATDEYASMASPEVEFKVVGKRRELHPLVRDEVARIGCEAIRNASLHSSASKLEIELNYSRDLYIRIQDNGEGIDPRILSEGRPGHFGLIGMRERADRISADLRISSTPGAGTTIALQVPARVAFLAPS